MAIWLSLTLTPRCRNLGTIPSSTNAQSAAARCSDAGIVPRMAIRRITPWLLLLAATACSTVQDDLSRQLLKPPPGWLAEPADFGLTAEHVEIPLHSEASLTGFWIPNAEAHGRTVVLFHDERTNASVLHPYYRFLHEAGLQVLAFDPRGYGRSKGIPTLQAWLYDLPTLFDWLHARPDVDREQVAFFGTGLGSVAALWAARTQGPCKALVLEGLPSLRDMLREGMGDDASALSAYTLGWVEFAGLPEGIEPDENAPRVKAPALFVLGDEEPARDRRALLRAYGEYGGPRQLWVLRATRAAPNGMLTYDGEYEQQIATFLQSAFANAPEHLATTWRKANDASDGQAWYELEISPSQPIPEPTAVEACALLADGSPHYARTWLEGARTTVRIKLPAAPQFTTAVRVFAADPDAAEVFRRRETPLTRSGAAIAPLLPAVDELRNDQLTPAGKAQLAADLKAAEARETFHPLLAAEFADVFARLGQSLLASTDREQHAEGALWLQRAIAAAPAEPRLHVWPGPTATYGYPREDSIATARRLLAAPAK
ncbi:MAG: alpha/beta hydrolase [Planctomycetota bacterium]